MPSAGGSLDASPDKGKIRHNVATHPEIHTILSLACERKISTTALLGEPDHPLRRSQPLLMKQWKYLWRKEYVELRRGLTLTGAGWVDEATADGSTMWIHLSGSLGRVMVHQSDGIDIWRVDAQILQDRREP